MPAHAIAQAPAADAAPAAPSVHARPASHGRNLTLRLSLPPVLALGLVLVVSAFLITGLFLYTVERKQEQQLEVFREVLLHVYTAQVEALQADMKTTVAEPALHEAWIAAQAGNHDAARRQLDAIRIKYDVDDVILLDGASRPLLHSAGDDPRPVRYDSLVDSLRERFDPSHERAEELARLVMHRSDISTGELIQIVSGPIADANSIVGALVFVRHVHDETLQRQRELLSPRFHITVATADRVLATTAPHLQIPRLDGRGRQFENLVDGRPYLHDFVAVEGGKYYLGIGYDKSADDKLTGVTLAVLGATFMLAIAVVAALTAYGARRIVRLKDAVVNALSGDTPQQIAIHGKDEIGALAQAFNEILSSLGRSTVSKSYVDNILQSMLDCLIVVDAEGVITRVNKATLQKLGYEEHELLGQHVGGIIQDDFLPGFRARDFASYCFEAIAETEYRTRDGRVIPMLFSAALLRDGAGAPTGLVFVAQDIGERKQAELRLQETLALQRGILDSADYMIIGCDSHGTILHFNKAAERHLGYAKEEAIGKINAAIFNDPAEVVRRAAALSVELGREIAPGPDVFITKPIMGVPDENEWTFIRKDGSRFPALLSITALRDESGEITGFLGIASDITERKAAEQQLRDTTALQRAVLDGANYSIIATDTNGVIVTFNRAAQQWLGYTEDEVVGRITPAILHDPAEVKRRAEELSHELNRPVEPGFDVFVMKSRLGYADEQEWSYIRKDGSRFPVLLSVTTIRDEKGEITGYMGVASDITERKRAEKQLRDALALQQAILDSANYLIMCCDPAGNIMSFNKAGERLLGYTSEEVVGNVNAAIFHDVAEVTRRAAQLSDELGRHIPPGPQVYVTKPDMGLPDENEWTFIRKDGSRFPGLLSITTLRDERNDVTAYLSIVSDITERKRAEQKLLEKTAELERSNRELNEFAYVTSHDLKAPLRAIGNLSQWIEEDIADQLTPDTRKQMDLLRGRVQRMENLINGILEYSRIGRVQVAVERADIGKLLHEIIDSMPLPDGYRVHVGEGMPVFDCAKLRLSQVLSNLISNAIKYRSRDDGNVRIEVADRDAFYEFTVADDGIGIAPAYHEKVFGIFQTLAARDKVESTGIGLSVVKKIIEEQGGTITLESEEGHGATFRFTWPKQPRENIAA